MEEPSLADPRARAVARTRTFATVYLAAVPVVVVLDSLWRQVERVPLGASPREPVLSTLWPERGLLEEVVLGAGAGLAVVLLEVLLRPRLRWLQELERVFHGILGKPTIPQCLGLAVVSGLAEETLFRGMLQPRWGLVLTSILFGLMHLVTWQYAVFAGVLGLLLGYLYLVTGGGLLAPVLCHMTINALGLALLSRTCPADAPPWPGEDA
jgi:membrane protease YdiL (CAAX protease family)